MDAPTVDAVQSLSAYLAEMDDGTLTAIVPLAAGIVASLTSRDIGVTAAGGGANSMGCDFEDVPAWMVPLVNMAVAMMAEVLVGTTSATIAKSRGNRLLASFTAGPYSETYFSPDVISKSKTLAPDATLASLLWSIATPCAQAYWNRLWGVLTAEAPAGVAVQTVPRIGWWDRPRY